MSNTLAAAVNWNAPQPALLEAFRAIVREELSAHQPQALTVAAGSGMYGSKPILTRAEARQYVRRTSDAAFSAWCARWQVRAECRGRWSRARLDLALAREAGTAHVPANLRK